MKKIIGIFMGLILFVGLFRFIAYVNSGNPISDPDFQAPKVDFWESIESTEEKLQTDFDGELFEFDEVFVDVQKVRYNFNSLTNSLHCSAGDSYISYKWVSGSAGSEALTIKDTNNNVVGHFVEQNNTKPLYTEGLIEWIAYIGNFFEYVGRMLYSVGGLLLDVLYHLIYTLYKLVVLVYTMLFNFS